LLQVLEGQPPANTPPIRATLLPGSRFRYSGSHYSVLQQLLADVSGTPFPQLMRELVLEPLGMHDSSYDQAFPETRLTSTAVGHYIGAQPVSGGWRVLPEMAAAGLWSSAPDLARLALELQRARQRKPTVLLSPEVVGEAFRTGPDDDWGLGIEFLGAGRNRTFGHGGANVGYKCVTRAACDSGSGAVVLTNGDDGLIIVEELLSGIAEQLSWTGLQPRTQPHNRLLTDLAQHVGHYVLRPDLELHVTLDDEGLRLHVLGQPPLRLELIDTFTFLTVPLDLKVAFTTDGLELDGQVAPRTIPSAPA
jgi:CubicO group peptidase (beta-lactamase class C family)